ncbi:hypothetical protein IAU59_005667 [Kwoniella sp. CBS 9459]
MSYYDPRQSFHSPQPAPPPRPSSAYDPYPDRSQSGGWQSPIPPPRPSSAYIAPFPGGNGSYNEPQIEPPPRTTSLYDPYNNTQGGGGGGGYYQSVNDNNNNPSGYGHGNDDTSVTSLASTLLP